jgi:hypothetical protein|tara:strand:- start:18271 stop:18690 length:420 start_codon:yes stop_codon:yes gene_type:complete
MSTVRITESDLKRIIQRVIKEQTSLEMPQSVKDELMGNLEDAGYVGDGEEVEELSVDEPLEVVPTEKTDTDWNTIGDFFKDYYAHVRERFSRVSPNEFDEITVLINAVVSLAGDINLDNKDAGMLVQQLTKRIKDQIKA